MSNKVFLLTMVIASSLNCSSPRLIPYGFFSFFLFFHHINGYDTDYKLDTPFNTLLHSLHFISFAIVLLFYWKYQFSRSKWKTKEYGLTYAVLLWGWYNLLIFHFSSDLQNHYHQFYIKHTCIVDK